MRIPFLIGACALALGIAAVDSYALTALRLESFINRNDVDGLKTALAKESDNLSLAQGELVRLVGTDGIKAIAAKPNGETFLRVFLGDQEWLEMFLASGPVGEGKPAAEGLMVLYDLWSADKARDARGFRPLATALALNTTIEPFRSTLRGLENSSLRPITPASRYFFFKNAYLANKLNPIFKTLQTWSLRFVVSANHDDQGLAWALDNVNLPAWRYVDACWFVEYRGVNAFGDTIQGPLFYMPWREQDNSMENPYKHGGVCGSLSTFGSVAARAHGIPSYTVGQPGHCAYAVRLGPGDWAGGFGGPAGGPHQYFWGGSYYYILLMEDAFAGALKTKDGITTLSDESTARTKMLNSQRHLWKAQQAIEKGDRRQAERDCIAALEAQSTNFSAWEMRINNASADPSVLAKGWQGLADEILAKLSNHTKPMCDLLAKFEEKQLLPQMDNAARLAWFERIHKTIAGTKGQITWDWQLDSVFANQIKQFPKDSSEQWAFFQNALALHAATNEQFLGQLLDWGVKNLGEGSADKCITALAAVVAEGGDQLNTKATEKILGTAILAAEKAKSRDAFQAAVKAASKYVKPTAPAKLERPEGLTLVSSDGLLTLSTTSGWDRPLEHGGVLTEKGGFFHTNNEKTPSATVELRNTTTLTGILLINSDGHAGRQKSLVVSVSTDGATWHKIWESDKVQGQWFIPLSDKGTRARWVKVESQHENPEVFHLRGILVYGESSK
ncbi:MAG: discoidin domain-containing protein [Puniceicoccales bacterium]|jgi:hypothetical protein|nr:discoidin domain-containing protein [Puniceicoccales bacterium]